MKERLQVLNRRDGFTLIEILVVIAIMGVLASLILGALTNAQKKSRDSRRISDIRQIHIALRQFHDDRGYLPTTASYGENNHGGWDYSSQGDFLPFLVPNYLSNKLVDQKNDGTGDVFYGALGGTGYSYAYYCYPAGTYAGTINLGARMESAAGTASTKVVGGVYWQARFEGTYQCQ